MVVWWIFLYGVSTGFLWKHPGIFEVLKSVVSNNKYDDIQKENATFKSMNQQIKDMIEPIQKTQIEYNKKAGDIDILISNLRNQITTFNNYLNNNEYD